MRFRQRSSVVQKMFCDIINYDVIDDEACIALRSGWSLIVYISDPSWVRIIQGGARFHKLLRMVN